jgi:acetyl/propionyl-CoA carboxylase alpha subunit
MPSGPGIRLDSGVEAGDRVPPDYDPLVAKLLVVDVDRGAAIARLARALDEVEVTGIQTTLPFHRFVASHPGFRAGDVGIGWVDAEWEPAMRGLRDAALEVASQGAAAVAASGGPAMAPPPTRGSTSDDGWRRAGRERAIDRWPR